ncbi:hypothetical protein HK099_001435 [Clydaea vesicula]|uniref:Solute carrier family 35 member F6 n=1 Tax=Clydaea vesicula TaxID=447962 RepID=A0AAD5Y185_9FUNG|nr:hypothetical protein HK099_001435 [Clydaea vesicula]
MLFTGTINTILNKLQDNVCISNCDAPDKRDRHTFEQPLWQTMTMFVGETCCLIVYYASTFYENRKKKVGNSHQSNLNESSPLIPNSSDIVEIIDEDGLIEMHGWANLWFWLPTVCDLISTTLMNVGLIYISASIYQMLRGSLVLFTGTLSVIFLHKRHPLYRWIALILVFFGVFIVGLSSVIEKGDASTVSPEKSIIGVTMVILAQIFTASQFVIEEKILCKYSTAPLKAVGLEGLFGLISSVILLPPLYLFFGKNGPPGGFFDIPEGFRQVFGYEEILYSGIGIILSIAFFNWFGLSVTRHISATSRSTIDTCRTLFIWMVSIQLGWETFNWVQVLGFMVLLPGTLMFNDVFKYLFEKKSTEFEEITDDN